MNKPEFDKTNITLWHSLGYKGQGINIVNFENCKDMPWFDGKVSAPKGWTTSTHGTQTMDVIHQVAPLAQKYSYNNSSMVSNGVIVKETYSDCLKFMKENDVSVVTASLGGNDHEPLVKIYKEMAEFSALLTSAGNKGSREPSSGDFNDTGVWIPVGAYHLINGKKVIAHYTSSGEKTVCSGFSNLNVHTHSLPWDGKSFRVTGTSFSSPMVAGQVALVQEFFKNKTGKTLNNDQARQFIIDHCDEGIHDPRTGYGLFILPHPNDIDIKKYFPDWIEPIKPPTPEPKPEPPTEETKIEMFIGSRTYYVNGRQKQMDVSAELYNGRTFVPVRFISEEFGSTVGWNGILKKVTIKGDKVVTMVIGKREYHVDGVLKYMDTAPMLVNGRTMVPVRFIAEAFGYKIGWDGSAQKVTIAK